MPRIPYVDPATVTDAEIAGYLELARREGAPRPESQAIRAHNPGVIRAFSQAWDPQRPTEGQFDELLHFADSSAFSEREKAALPYTSAIICNAEIPDDPRGGR